MTKQSTASTLLYDEVLSGLLRCSQPRRLPAAAADPKAAQPSRSPLAEEATPAANWVRRAGQADEASPVEAAGGPGDMDHVPTAAVAARSDGQHVSGCSRPAKGKGSRPQRCRQAAILSESDDVKIVEFIEQNFADHASPLACYQASLRLGLRPCEIAGMRLSSLVTASGEIAPHVTVMPGTSKRGRGRAIPCDPTFAESIRALLARHPTAQRLAFSQRPNGSYCNLSAREVSRWFSELYRRVGIVGASGMSGRRTYANRIGRKLLSANLPLPELQHLLGHARIRTTQFYLRESATPDAAALALAVRMQRGVALIDDQAPVPCPLDPQEPDNA